MSMGLWSIVKNCGEIRLPLISISSICGAAWLNKSRTDDLPGKIWSRTNVRLDRNPGGQHHAQKTVYARRDYPTSADDGARHRQRAGRARGLSEARDHRTNLLPLEERVWRAARGSS